MKKRIYILTLTFLFLVSTTGMPLVLHYCKMMQSVSFEICEMHSIDTEKYSCCESQSLPDSYYSKVIDECCKDIIVDYSVEEIFVKSISESVSLFCLDAVAFVYSDLISVDPTYYQIDTSPPTIAGNKIYITNSIFLI